MAKYSLCIVAVSVVILKQLTLLVAGSSCYQEITVQVKGHACSTDEVLASEEVKQGKAGPKGSKGESGLAGPKGSQGQPCNCEKADALVNTQDYINYYHNIKFRYPRHNNVNDWVKYMSPIPQMTAWTMCMWVVMYTVRGSHLVSYAYPGMDNGVIIAIDSTTRLRSHINGHSHYIEDSSLNFQPNIKTHICVQFSHANQQVDFYKDGLHVGTKAYTAGDKIFTGRGSLVFGQEQDNLGGGFAASDTFDGELTNFLMWPRVLTREEISDVTSKCKYPRDFIIRPQLNNIEWNGRTEISFPEICPTT